MIRRKDHIKNYKKLTNDKNFDLNDWIKAVETQVKNWCENFSLDYPVLIFNTDKLVENQDIMINFLKNIFEDVNSPNFLNKERKTNIINDMLGNKLENLIILQNSLPDYKIFYLL